MDISAVPERKPFMPGFLKWRFRKTGGKAFTLIQANSPSVDLPPNIDVSAMGEMLLQVWGLTPDEAHRTAAAIDWTSTLVIPLPVNTVAYSEVTVEGSPGLYIEGQEEGRGRSSFTLLWQKDEVVYALMGPGTLERALEIANSMQ